MSDKSENLDANEKAALESMLYRCRALVGRIGEELRKKKPEHFVDERSLADFHTSLERAAWVLEQQKRQTQDTTEALPPTHSRRARPQTAHPAGWLSTDATFARDGKGGGAILATPADPSPVPPPDLGERWPSRLVAPAEEPD